MTQITEGRNVQKEAETLQLDSRSNRNEEELSFGNEQTAEPSLFFIPLSPLTKDLCYVYVCYTA